ncbi:hypothetical protein AMAG_19389 [Allomyces macrogynus ATCC 38327]|uniref:Fungal lipase-type domain-containing protein n=1 Tax=Allomyces macrogynus (strain ATCC 38327) TaxID=578462 RepID=A0A0L0SUS6_ALLM3|nr:hypothetical protein AMAG_19389 [Allomyces macrogynus ATCC 38327]|eukprot:KNE66338.1 hypothetical protein AMAG_19389 [Allomyces macrogynus ATCC 38327]
MVAFRGSSNVANWIDNLEFGKIAYPFTVPATFKSKPKVHKGFVDAYNEVRPILLQALATAKSRYPTAQITITGHSLGGAIATLAAADIAALGMVAASRVKLTVFNSPRVGTSEFSDLVGSLNLAHVARYVEENDIVSHLPPTFLGFEHIVGEKYQRAGTVYACVGAEDQSSCGYGTRRCWPKLPFRHSEEVEAKVVYADPVHDFGVIQFNPKELRAGGKDGERVELRAIQLAPSEIKVGIDVKVPGADYLAGKTNAGYVAYNAARNSVMVAFRGSSNVANWIDNLEFGKIAYPFTVPATFKSKPKVHKGFVDAYNEVRPILLQALATAKSRYPTAQITITGHSLGGAIATLAAADIAALGMVAASRVKLTVFNSPRVGTSEFSDLVGSLNLAHVARYVEENDIVSHLPPTFLGFEHIVGEKYQRAGTVYACVGAEDQSCSDARVPFTSISAHLAFFGKSGFFGGSGC